MFKRISVSVFMGLMVVFGAKGHEFGEQHCSLIDFWASVDWIQVEEDDEKANVAKHCVLAHTDRIDHADSDGTALHHVINNTYILQLLIENGADVNGKNASDNTPLHYAVAENLLESSKMLIENGANINSKGRYIDLSNFRRCQSRSLMYSEDRYGLIGYSIDYPEGYSPRDIAVQCGYNRIAKLLLESRSQR